MSFSRVITLVIVPHIATESHLAGTLANDPLESVEQAEDAGYP
jgi:hypothetical protein